MSRRVRHTAGTAEEAHSASTRAGSVDLSASSWHAAFQAFSEDDRARILELALPAGVVYAQQLPDAKPARKPEEHAGGTLAPFMNGQTRQLTPSLPAQVEFFDGQLDRRQRDAVARALATPDIFLLRGDPGAGKSRVVLELIRQEMKRGNRILFLSQNPAALDWVLSDLASAGEALAIRCSQPDTDGRLLRPEIQALLLANRVAALTKRAREAGNRELTASRQHQQELQQALASWPRLVDLHGQLRNLQAARSLESGRLANLERDLQAVLDSPETGAADDPIVQALIKLNDLGKKQSARADEAISRLEQSVSERKVDLDKLSAENRDLAPLLEARKANRFWTGAWWKATLNSAKTRRAAEVAGLIASTKGQLEQHELALATALAERQSAIDNLANERGRVLEEERSRRQGALSSKIAALDGRIEERKNQLREQQDRLPALGGVSLTDQEELEPIYRQVQERNFRAEAAGGRSEEWLALLDRHPHALRDALIEHTLLVCATPSGWAADRDLAARFCARPFDLLILEEADQFSEVECATYASLANRWVLVSDDACSSLDIALAGGAGSDRRTGQISSRSFFARLWQHLHADPQRLPYSWLQEGNNLVCRLRSVAPEQRAWIEAERLADHPQIVLHILALPRSRPVVAEVLFPAAFTIQSAKQFILQELQELAVHAPVHSMHWHEDNSDRLVLQLANQFCQHGAAVELMKGVQEHLHLKEAKGAGAQSGVHWQTCCIEFDRGSGWQRSTAEEWVERHLGLRDLGRTIYLDSLHRYSDGLASFARLLMGARSAAGTGTHGQVVQPTEAFEFVAVPEKGRPERRFNADRPRSAGFELDLSEARSRERIPPGLRAGLPAQGFVNLAEAQAIVRRLEEWNRAGALPASVFVVALYDAQAEIIRRQLKASPSLSSCAPRIEIGVPETFAHREAPWVIVSMTRSHAQQAVALGKSPRDLLLALTRGRERVVLFGDPGALLRRLQASGASGGDDASPAVQERSLLNVLVTCGRLLESRLVASVGSEGHAT